MNNLGAAQKGQLERLQWYSLAVGIVALVVCVLGGWFSPTQFFRSYLVAFLFFLGIAHGCFVTLMVYHLTGGAWGFLIRRILEAGMRTLPVLAILFVPIPCGISELYLWAQPDAVAASKDLQHKQIYLNVSFFCLRGAFFFLSWLTVAYFLSSWSRQQDRTEDPAAARQFVQKFAYLSGPGLVIFGITITFAVVDWVMSLQPAFRSTIIGPLFVSGEILTGFSCALIVLAWLIIRPPLSSRVSIEAVNDLGSLLFTFLILWAYMTFFQFMLIWIADLPYDVIWYLPRSTGGWQWVALAILIFHFLVPFFLLLMRDIKRSPRALATLGGLILFMHLAYLNYQVLPAFEPTGLDDHWMDFVAPFAVGGLWLSSFVWDLKRGPLLPNHDVNEEAAVRYRQLDEEQLAREEVGHV